MTVANIRNALESALASIAPAIAIVHENEAYAPVDGVPYCAAYLMLAPPENPTMGSAFYRESGIFQVSLFYPLEVGTADAAARASLIRDTFRRGLSFTDGGATVQIQRTPEIGAGTVDGDRWFVPVKVRWWADIQS